MTPPSIQIENVAKRYRIGERPRAHRRLIDALSGHTPSAESTTLWALRDVSLQIDRGAVVGIIGRNGAGKTTLLKVLARITKPSAGRVVLTGRVGALLEVGTGFHPELTGRENTLLNGAILGMRRAEIARRFDEIVAFAEIERFIDTPVKHYSSGMYVRLAFAVAAHLEPEILLVDEVLAVGDAVFQKKCLGKMDEVGQQGRTVLFVSHNMTAVKALCGRAVLLEAGRVAADGPTIDVVKEYRRQTTGDATAERSWNDTEPAPENRAARLLAVRIRDEQGAVGSDIDSQRPFSVEVDFRSRIDGVGVWASIVVHNADGECVLSSASETETTEREASRRCGTYRSICRMPGNFFPDGCLNISVILHGDADAGPIQADGVLTANIHETEGSVRGDFLKVMTGVVRPMLPWSTELVHS